MIHGAFVLDPLIMWSAWLLVDLLRKGKIEGETVACGIFATSLTLLYSLYYFGVLHVS